MKILILTTILIIFSSLSLCAENLVFYTQDFPPFSYMENNQVSGPAVDIIKEVCKEMGTTCSFELMPWTRATAEAKEGKSNGLFVIGWNEERATWMFFSQPIIETEYGFFVHKDSNLQYKKPADLGNATVAVYGPSNTSTSLEKLAKSVPSMKIDMTIDDESAFRKLDSGRVSAVYSNKDVGLAMIKKMGINNVKYSGTDKPLEYYIGFIKKSTNENTVKKFNDTYKKLVDQNKIEAILKKYSLRIAKMK